MSTDCIEVKSFGEVYPKKGTNTRTPYEHQKKAMACLDKVNSSPAYSTLVVLPTGGGKTYTASMWLLKNALDKKKKILWIAHRQMLLDQAAESFQKFAYAEVIPHISSFRFRVISGASSHDRTSDIQPSDNVLIVSKDSIGRNLDRLDKWLAGEQELYLVVDEAHHSTAKTYRKVISALFNKAKIKTDFIVSDVKDSITGVTISRAENERKLEAYQEGCLQVLINVNILTEGVDLPQTKTVFLARPTVSSILMTQMVGRALRGTAAGGTSEAYIVSFVDNWNEHIAWVNPESLFSGSNEFDDTPTERAKHHLRMIAISKIEEFASVLDDAVDTTALEKVPFVQRIPLGMYAFTYLEENGMDLSYQVMVYDSTAEAYRNLMDALPALFRSYHVTEEYPTDRMLGMMEQQCRDTFFCGEMVPPYEPRDVINILKYYAQYEAAPQFYTFDEIDRSKLDVSQIAQHIWDEDMGERKRAEYVNSIWNAGDDNMLRLFFGRKLYFLRQLDIECMKISHPGIYEDEQNVKYGTRQLEDLPLYEIGQVNPEKEKELRDGAFEKSRGKDGLYHCACCGTADSSRIFFQVDHIVPMNKGGKSIPENLQILCRKCNGGKGDK